MEFQTSVAPSPRPGVAQGLRLWETQTRGGRPDSRFKIWASGANFFEKQSQQVIENTKGRPKIGQNKAKFGLAWRHGKEIEEPQGTNRTLRNTPGWGFEAKVGC